MPRPKVLLLITLAEVGGAQAYVASLLPVLVERFDVVVAAHGPGPLRTAAEEAGVRFVALRHVRPSAPGGTWPASSSRTAAAPGATGHPPREQLEAGVAGRLAAAATGVPIRIFTVHGWAFAATPAPPRCSTGGSTVSSAG